MKNMVVVLLVGINLGIFFGCNKDDSKNPEPKKIIVPTALTGEFKAKAIADKSALPTNKEIDDLLVPFKRVSKFSPDISLFQDEKSMSSLSSSERSDKERSELKSSIQEKKAKKSEAQLKQHQQLLDNCSYSNRPLRNDINKDTHHVGISTEDVITSEYGKSCPIYKKFKTDIDLSAFEQGENKKITESVGTLAAQLDLKYLDGELIRNTAMKSVHANISGNFASRTASTEFLGGSQNTYGKVNFVGTIDLVDKTLSIVGGFEVLINNEKTNLQMYIKLSTPSSLMSMAIVKSPQSESYYLNGNEFDKEQFTKVTKEVFKDFNLDEKEYAPKTSSLDGDSKIEFKKYLKFFLEKIQ